MNSQLVRKACRPQLLIPVGVCSYVGSLIGTVTEPSLAAPVSIAGAIVGAAVVVAALMAAGRKMFMPQSVAENNN